MTEKTQRNRWTGSEVDTLKRMAGKYDLAAICEAIPRHTLLSVKDKLKDIGQRSRSPHVTNARWLRICAQHRPRIILAAPFPAAREVMS